MGGTTKCFLFDTACDFHCMLLAPPHSHPRRSGSVPWGRGGVEGTKVSPVGQRGASGCYQVQAAVGC